MHCLHRVVGAGVAAGRHHQVAEQGGAAAGHGTLEEPEAGDEVGPLRCRCMWWRCGGDVDVDADVDVDVDVDVVEMWWRVVEMWWRCGGDVDADVDVDVVEM